MKAIRCQGERRMVVSERPQPKFRIEDSSMESKTLGRRSPML